jgi:hypothetical protein
VSRTAEAEALAADTAELGELAAGIVAQGRAARVAPEATRGLVAAALTLEAPQMALYAAAVPLRSDAALLDAAATLEADAGEMLAIARGMRAEAAEARRAAAAAAREAAAREGRDGTTEATRLAIAAAVSEGADCDCALEILDVLIRRLHYATGRLGQVPDDLETAYEVPYAHVRRGGALPRSGDFLLSDTTTRGAA